MATPTTALQVVNAPPSDAAIFLPVMQIEHMKGRFNAVNQLVKDVMQEGIHFGTIPGVAKPSLLKPGAECVCTLFGWSPRFEIVEKIEDWDAAEPTFYYLIRCSLYRAEQFVGEALGSANSRESKHRYRWVAESELPGHLVKDDLLSRDGTRMYKAFDFAVKSAETTGPYGKPPEYWQAFQEAIENGTAKESLVEMKGGRKGLQYSITVGARQFRIPNPDIADVANTLVKMAQKRAFVAVTLVAANLSDKMTQDVEDLPEAHITADPMQQQNTPAQQADKAQQRIAEERTKLAEPTGPHAAFISTGLANMKKRIQAEKSTDARQAKLIQEFDALRLQISKLGGDAVGDQIQAKHGIIGAEAIVKADKAIVGALMTELFSLLAELMTNQPETPFDAETDNRETGDM